VNCGIDKYMIKTNIKWKLHPSQKAFLEKDDLSLFYGGTPSRSHFDIFFKQLDLDAISLLLKKIKEDNSSPPA
jgi:hypothetical protein